MRSIKYLLILIPSLLNFSQSFALECERTACVKVFNSWENRFNVSEGEFIDAFGGHFSPLTLVPCPAKSEYTVAVTFNSEKADSTFLGVAIGFTGGNSSLHGTVAYKSAFPVEYIGSRVGLWGNTVDGSELENHSQSLAASIAEFEGISRLLSRYEQMPSEAEAEVKVKCFRPGEQQRIVLRSFESNFPDLVADTGGSDQVINRIVVVSENGRILTGRPLASDKRARVLTIPSKRDSSHVRFTEYVAPEKEKTDKLTIYNSCDIKKENLTPLENSVKYLKILEFDVPICDDYKLEYSHDLMITYKGTKLNYKAQGVVPFRVSDREGKVVYKDGWGEVEDLEIEGEGTIAITMQGPSGDECFLSYEGSMESTLKGTAKPIREGDHYVWKFHLSPEENYAKKFTMVLTCPDDEGSFSMMMPAPPIKPEPESLVIKDQDGETVHQPFEFEYGSGTYKWILHTPERE